eukprot:COSAG01_NODE_433_length_17113_cov_23.009757_8_plen_113_part_00
MCLTTCVFGSGAMPSSAAIGRLRGARDLSDVTADIAEEIIPPLEKSSIPPAQLLHEWWCVFSPQPWPASRQAGRQLHRRRAVTLPALFSHEGCECRKILTNVHDIFCFTITH